MYLHRREGTRFREGTNGSETRTTTFNCKLIACYHRANECSLVLMISGVPLRLDGRFNAK